jgi:hypothetical protein
MVRAWMAIVTHRTFVFDYGTVHAFDTAYAARRFIRNNRDPDLMVLAREKLFFKRQDRMELHIVITATRCEENATYLDAARQIARHIEQEIEIAADMASEGATANG